MGGQSSEMQTRLASVLYNRYIDIDKEDFDSEVYGYDG